MKRKREKIDFLQKKKSFSIEHLMNKLIKCGQCTNDMSGESGMKRKKENTFFFRDTSNNDWFSQT